MVILFRVFALLLAAVLMATQAISETLPLVGTTWRWTATKNIPGAVDLKVPRPSQYLLELAADGHYGVRADCNRGQGKYVSNGDELRFAPGPTTLAECGPQSLADRFLELLVRVSGMRQEGDRLTLTLTDKGGVMDFEGRQPTTLAGTSWLVRAYNNGQEAIVSTLAGSTVTATFDADGTINGLAGCNRYSASYEVTAGKITVGSARTTRKACRDPAGVMDQEARFLAALEASNAYRIEGARMQLRADDGALLVELVSAVTGDLNLPQGSVIPPDASVRIQIQDVSLADAPAQVIGEQRLSASGREAPIEFEVDFDPADIDPRHSYSAAARVHDAQDRLLFVSTRSYSVITRGSPQFGVSVDLDTAQ